MALNAHSYSLAARLGAVAVCLWLLGGCAAGPEQVRPQPDSTASAPRVGKSRPVAEEPQVAAAADWETFRKTGAALSEEIAIRAEALKQGAIGNRAVELASLRLAASGRDLIDAGSLDGAVQTLQRAVSLFGGNGFAYLYLAYVHQVNGRSEQAGEFAARAARYLPRSQGVRAELAGLQLAIRHSAGASPS